jgi:uncharacterized protein involved in exopolysaccharide biosynthesis
MENNQNYEYDEISIKELIEVVIKGKKVIAGITIAILLLTIAFTFYVQKPTYESKTTLLVTNVTAKVANANVENMEDYINTLSAQSLNTLETYKQQIKSPEVLSAVIENLKLDKEKYTINGLMNMISVAIIKDTNLIAISVKSGDPKDSEKIANEVSNSFVEFINDVNQSKVNQSVKFLKISVDEQSVKLENAMVKYEEFLKNNESIDTVKNELEILLGSQKESQIRLETLDSDYDINVLNNSIDIKNTENKLNAVKKVLATVDEKLVINKNIIGNDLLREVLTDSGLTLKDLININLEEESYNENYLLLMDQKNNLIIDLNGFIYNKEIIKERYDKEKELVINKTADVSESLENLQVEFAEMDHQNQLITNEISSARETYELLLNKYNEIKVTESVKAGEMNIVINSKAYASDNPISPNKKLNLAIGLILGLMIGVFVVFFMNMWKTEEK